MESQENSIVPPVCPIPNEDPIEMYEEAIVQFRKWLSVIYSPSKIDRAFRVEYLDMPDTVKDLPSNNPRCRMTFTEPEPTRKLHMCAKIWTLNNVYNINASMHVLNPPGCLMGSANSRKPRTGETWCRGNDLKDGPFCEETWNGILADIVRYEAEEVKSEKWKDTNVVH